ncbi:hypothetical protein O6H91_09G036200 [Diphasiastrum complanatum]|nr:hypothetical protein O6H91_09G036200 [Diphasiastrum complanatum]
MAMRHPRKVVLAGCLGALVVMTILSAVFGWATPNLLSRKWTHYATTVLFLVFGAHSLWEGIMEEQKESELAEVEAKMDGQLKSANGLSAGKQTKIDDDDHDLKKQKKLSLAAKYFSPIFLEAFSLTFLGEWGDRSQIATVGLAAAENVIGVALGGILGQSLCTCAAIWGGKHLASRISEKAVAICGGVLFIIFGIHSILSGYTEIV